MSSAPPPGGGPSQAGRFKPRRPATKKKATTGSSIAPGASAGAGRSRGSGRSSDGGGRGGRGDGRGEGRGGGRGEGRGGRGEGRGGRGRGRGRGRGGRGGRGRFVVPSGRAFFTGNEAKGVAGAAATRGDAAATAAASQQASAAAAAAEIASGIGISMPGQSAPRSSGDGAGGGAGRGEGEEIVVGEIEGGGIGAAALERKARGESAITERTYDGPSMFGNDEEDMDGRDVPEAAYTYDSDSSEEERRRSKKGSRIREVGLAPATLPFPMPYDYPSLTSSASARSDRIMYDSQREQIESTAPVPDVSSSSHVRGEEKKSDEVENEGDHPRSAEEDPPLFPPFLDPAVASEDERKRESESWVLVQFPTRLPRLDPMSTLSGSIKAEGGAASGSSGEVDVDAAAMAPSSSVGTGGGGADGGGAGFDDTLRDARAGRYGRIVVRRSGKAELIVGGGDTGAPEVRMALTEGLRAGFARQAVAIDHEQGVYVPIGDVGKDLVVMPDAEGAFPDS